MAYQDNINEAIGLRELGNCFAEWHEKAFFPQELLDEPPPLATCDAFISGDAKRSLFIGRISHLNGDLQHAAQCLVLAFSCEKYRLTSDDAEYWDAVAEGMPTPTSLSAILADADPVARMHAAIEHNSEEIRALTVTLVRNSKPEPLSEGEQHCCFRQAVKHVYDCIVRDGEFYGKVYLLHKALFWAMAGWAKLKRVPLFEATPCKKQCGPYFTELGTPWKHIQAWDEKPIVDPDMLRILEAAATHVLRYKSDFQLACEETRREPIWLVYDHDERLSLLVNVYSRGDVTGKLHEIFPWLPADHPRAFLTTGAAQTLSVHRIRRIPG
jgi:hypothetical protein